jgi:hypothetical protein
MHQPCYHHPDVPSSPISALYALSRADGHYLHAAVAFALTGSRMYACESGQPSPTPSEWCGEGRASTHDFGTIGDPKGQDITHHTQELHIRVMS